MNPPAPLPNTQLIARVKADCDKRRLEWEAAWNVASDAHTTLLQRENARAAAWQAVNSVGSPAGCRTALWHCISPLWDAVLALWAWPEESAALLDMPVDAARLLAAHGHHPAVLMLPACIARSGD